MFFWNSLAFTMIQRILAVWSLVSLPFLKPAWTSGSSRFTYCWSLAWRILSITLLVWHQMAASKCWVQMPSFEPTAGWGWVLQAQVSHMQIRPLMSSPSEVVPTVPRTCWMESRVSSHTFILVTYNQTTCPGMHFELILKKNYLVPSIIIMHWIFFFLIKTLIC